jgi:O-antigen/teichoic acid export membrane protein
MREWVSANMAPDLVKHLALSLLGASAARAIYFAMLPLAARIYTKDDFGGLALVLGFVGMAPPFLTLRYEIAVVLVRSAAAARALVWGIFGISAVGYAIVAGVVVTAPALLAYVVDPELMASLQAPVLLHVAASVLNVSIVAWLQRKKAFATIATSQFTAALATAALVLGAPFTVDPTLPVLVWAFSIGALVTSGVLCIGSVGTGLFDRRFAGRCRRTLLLLSKYRVYPAYCLPLSMSALVSDRALLLYLSTAFSVGVLGGFFPVRQLLFGFVNLVTASISQVVFPHMSQMAEGVLAARRLVLSMARSIAVIAGLSLGLVWLYSTELTLALFGDQWKDFAAMMPWIATHAATVAIAGWQGRILDLARRQRADAMLQIAGDFASVLGIVALWLAGVTATVAIAVVSTLGIAHAVAWLIVAYRLTGIGATEAIACIGALVASATAAAMIAMVCNIALGHAAGMIVSLTVILCGMVAILLWTVPHWRVETA